MQVEEHIKEILEIRSNTKEIRLSKEGLKKHLIKRKHDEVLKYLDNINEIISNPDYVGINPNEKEESLEYIKVFEDNVLVALKIHSSKEYYYIPSMYTITDYKLKSRLYSGRLKKVDKDEKN